MESLKRPEVLAFINPRNHHTDPSVREYGCLDPATDTVNGFSVSTDSEFEETHEYDYETMCTIQEMVALVTSTDSANPVPQETTGGTPKTAEKTYEWVAEDRIYDPPEQESLGKETRHGALTKTQADSLNALLAQFEDIYSKHRWDLGTLDPKYGMCEVQITDKTPVNHRMPKWSYVERQWLREDIDVMSKSPPDQVPVVQKSKWAKYGHPTRYVIKPDMSRRFCTNFGTGVNKCCAAETWPIPDVESTIMEMDRPMYFTAIDLTQAFFQVLVHPSSRRHLSLLTPDGIYEYCRMPMGYKNSPAIMCKVFDRMLEDLPKDPATGEPFFKIFIDDLVIFSQTWEDHLEHLTRVLSRLREAGLKLRFSKCTFAFDTIKYLGHVIDREGVRVDPDKTAAVLNLQPPNTPAGVKSFLAMAGYFRGHLGSGYAKLHHALRERETLAGSRTPWTTTQLQAFDKIKTLLTEAPCLRRPDFSQPFQVHTDWSQCAMGAVLMQIDPTTGLEHPVRYSSRLCTDPEANLSPTMGEAACLVWALEKYRAYLYGHKFTVYTDHNCLMHLMSPTLASPKLNRWAARLDEFGNFKIVYRKGIENIVPDYFSRHGAPVSFGEAVLTVLMHEYSGNVQKEISEDVPAVHAVPVVEVSRVPDEYTNAQVRKYSVCDVCKNPDGERNMLECDECGLLVHRTCANPFRASPGVGRFVCHRCDPEHEGVLDQYFNTDTTRRYHDDDPYVDEELLAYMAGDLRANAADAVYKRAATVRFHPTLPGFLQTYRKVGGRGTWTTVPPVEYRDALLREAHEDCGHGGVQRTLRHLRPRYVWRGMTADIKEYVRTCHECQVARATMGAPTPVQESDQVHLGQAWHLDLCGPFEVPTGEKGPKGKPVVRAVYVMVAAEAFSRWTTLTVLADKSPISVVFAFYRAVLCRHGLPEWVTTDRGTEFCSVFDQMCHDLHIIHKRTATRHPQSNGLAERTVQKVKRAVEALADRQPSAVIRLIPRVQYVINTERHSSTGFAPYELMHGRTPRVSEDLARFIPEEAYDPSLFPYGVHANAVHVRDSSEVQDSRDHEEILKVRDALFHMEGEAYMRNARAKYRNVIRSYHQWVQAKNRGPTPGPGDAVLILRPPQMSGKRASVIGPFLYERKDPKTGMAVIRSGETRGVQSKQWLERTDSLVQYHFPEHTWDQPN